MDLEREPWRYPGPVLEEAIVLGVAGDGQAGHARLLTQPSRRVGQAGVRLPDGDVPLDDCLVSNDVAGADVRRPVIAFGSNASPGVLLRKLAAAGVSRIVPMRPGVLADARVGASAHVSRAGYVPAAAGYERAARLPVVIAWLDDEQVACLDATEPNYIPLVLEGLEHRIHMSDNGERLSAATVYDTRWGMLPVGVSAADQAQLWRRVIACSPRVAKIVGRAATDEAWARRWALRLQEDQPLRAEVSEHLQAMALPTRLRGEKREPPTYAECTSSR